MKLSEKLRKLRENKGKTQQEVANDLGFHINSLRNYENDILDRLPDTHQLKKLKEYYDVTYEYLLDDNCENKSNETIDIGSILKLSDKAIENIKALQIYRYEKIRNNKIIENTISPKSFNLFLEDFKELERFTRLLNQITELMKLEKQLFFFNSFNRLQDFVIYSVVNGNKNDLNELFRLGNSKIELLENLSKDILGDKQSFNDLKDSYYVLQSDCKKQNTSQKILFKDFELFNMCEINFWSILHKEITFTKYLTIKTFESYLDLKTQYFEKEYPISTKDEFDELKPFFYKFENIKKNNTEL